ncbi:MAG: transglutaminase domain-containing protein [bacterium]|nr:transglutaminase domain-containing protein [bacterium]
MTTAYLFACAAVLAADVEPIPALTSMFTGGTVTDWPGLEAYTGLRAANAVVGADRQAAARYNYDQLQRNYGENVDFQLRREQAILCPQTVEFLYSEFAPSKTRYVQGSRPVLERVVAEATAGCATDTDKALALMRRCRDNYDEKWYGNAFDEYIYGGTEEELLEKGEILCECLGRLHVALCEIAGIPGRVVMHVIGGHICSEVYIDGHWAYMDPRCGMYFRKPDGTLASVWDLMQHPGLINAQADDVKADAAPWWTWDQRAWKCRTLYFTPQEVNGFQNYSLADSGRYTYAQKTMQQVIDDGMFEVNKKYCAKILAVFGLTEDELARMGADAE